jgi:hypothetical protein
MKAMTAPTTLQPVAWEAWGLFLGSALPDSLTGSAETTPVADLVAGQPDRRDANRLHEDAAVEDYLLLPPILR